MPIRLKERAGPSAIENGGNSFRTIQPCISVERNPVPGMSSPNFAFAWRCISDTSRS